MVLYVTRLSNQLIQTLFGDCAGAIRRDVRAMVLARLGTVDSDAKPHGPAVSAASQCEVQLTCVEPIDDAPTRRAERRVFGADFPVAREAPVVQRQPRGC